MKVALIFSGQFREAKHCYKGFKENILDIYNPDVFISTWSNSSNINPAGWRYNNLSDNIFNIFSTESGCRVVEVVTDIDTNQIDTFEYVINKNNIDFVSKLKKYSI
jgi:hypothetical protein